MAGVGLCGLGRGGLALLAGGGRAGIHIALNIVLLILCCGRSGGAQCVVLVLGSVCGCGP